MKKITVLASSLIIIIVTTVLLTHLWLYSTPSTSVNTAENAIATKDLIAIAHINNKRINSIMEMVGSDPQSLDLPIFDDNVFSELYYGENKLKENIEQVVMSINGQQDVSHNLLLQGKFEWKTIQTVFDKYFYVELISANNYKLTQRQNDDDAFVCPDERAKKVKQPYYLYANKQWLVISTKQQQLSLTTERLLSQQQADVDLTNWRDYRNQYLASMTLFSPENAPKMATGFTSMMVKKAVKANQEISAVYVGVDLNLLKRGINLNSQINADAQWATKAQNIAQQHITALQKEVENVSPTLAQLLNNFSIAAEQQSLVSHLTLKEQDIAKLDDVFVELIGSVFSAARGDAEVVIEDESIEESLWDYRLNDKLSTLGKFEANNFFGTPSLIDGPLAILLSKVQINEKSNLLELSVQGALNMPKVDGWWSDSKASFTLKVDSVTDKQGKEMMRDERCIKDLGYFAANHKVETFLQSSNELGTVSKTIRLKANSQFKEVANITGVLSFTIPTNVQTVDVKLKKGESYQQNGVRFFLNNVTQQSISYQLSGEKEKLLEVRGLNAKGEVLKESYSSTIAGKKTTRYKGDVVNLQLLIATKHSAYTSEFNLTADNFLPEQETTKYYLSVRPQMVSKEEWFKVTGKALKEKNVMDFLERGYASKNKVASWYQAPIGLLLTHNIKSTWNPDINYQLAIPLQTKLTDNLQAIEIKTRYENVQAASYFTISPYIVINDDQSRGEYRPHRAIDDIGFVKGGTEVKLGVKPQQKMGEVEGALNINLPKVIATINIGKPGFTAETFTHGISVNIVTIESGFIPRYEYKVVAPNLINMIAVLDDGRELLPSQSVFENGHWQLRYPLTQKIDHFEVLVATELDQVIYPFKLAPDYQ